MKSQSPKREGKATNRLEALTDSAFAFALTLLVIASGPPRSLEDLPAARKLGPYRRLGLHAARLRDALVGQKIRSPASASC